MKNLKKFLNILISFSVISLLMISCQPEVNYETNLPSKPETKTVTITKEYAKAVFFTSEDIENGIKVTMSTETEGASIYYTTDSTEPTNESSLYSEPLTFTKNTIVKAIAIKSGIEPSPVSVAIFTKKTTTVTTEVPVFSDKTDREVNKVAYYQQSLDGISYALKAAETKTVAKDSVLADFAKDYEGFTAKGYLFEEYTDGSFILNVYYTRNIIKVTLNGNTGKFGTEETKEISLYYEQNLTSISLLGLLHETKVFSNWNTSADGTGTSYEDAALVVKEPLTLYAIWLDYFEMTASEAVTKIQSLPEGQYTFKITGSITNDDITSIKTAMLTNTSRYIDLDLTQTTGLTELAEEAFTNKVNYNYTGAPLTSLSLPESVTSIGKYCFYNCKKMTKIYAPGVKKLETGALYVCESLTEYTFADVLDSVESLAFGFCRSLTELYINARSINNSTFAQSCYKLKKIIFGPDVTKIPGIEGVSSLEEIQVDEANEYFIVKDGILFSKDKTTLIRCPVSNNIESYTVPGTVTQLSAYAFSYCKYIKNISIPNVSVIPSDAFISCSALETVSIPRATKIEGMTFYHCTNLSSIELPDTLTSIGMYAFKGDKKLSAIYIPASVTTILGYAFENWTDTQTINCAATSIPSKWESKWNTNCNATINWGATRE